MSKPMIECEVNTCTNWISGNQCGAANIDILNQEENLMAQVIYILHAKPLLRSKDLPVYSSQWITSTGAV